MLLSTTPKNYAFELRLTYDYSVFLAEETFLVAGYLVIKSSYLLLSIRMKFLLLLIELAVYYSDFRVTIGNSYWLLFVVISKMCIPL